MGLLSSIELPRWLMIGGASLIATGSRVAFSRNREVAPNPESPPEPRPKMPPLPRLLDSSSHKGGGCPRGRRALAALVRLSIPLITSVHASLYENSGLFL
jgi:hypothetical protein